MSTRGRRVLLLTTVVSVAALSVGVAAYSAGRDAPAPSAVAAGAGPASASAGTPETTSPSATVPSVTPAATARPDVPKTPAVSEYFYGLITQCMATASFDWQADISYANGVFLSADTTRVEDVAPARQADFTLALYGDTTAMPYTWEDTGCWGYALHLTGNDGTS
ncbi:hypothetical protein [Cryobacterium sp. PAMC25264]|uniref:hypothetical protein n=1 Tax=Cryobacterium sp. PAMC25264 TaxID=2861288 RepID=UPI001C627F3B|nr:hypothetical protein [Cryobacterium sp. PAMC25264]QYF74206.1 hypothetical protein KY500_02955 [Cryobacterium sp. PAMC25264]